jgi:hypothetical protein
MSEDDLVMAKQLREVVGGEADAPFRQIEAQFVAHRPAQPGIDARCGRPHALDKSAQDDAIGFRQACFELAEDMELCVGELHPPYRSIGEGGPEKFGIVSERSHQADALPWTDQIVEGRGQCEARGAFERACNAVMVGREIDQHLAVTVCEFGEIMRG